MAGENPPTQGEATALAGGNYELLRTRLTAQSKVLHDKVDALNEDRLTLFGKTDRAIVGNVRVRTDNNCVPRDIIQVGGQLLFGYNVFLGMKTHTSIQDVMSLHTLNEIDGSFEVHPSGETEGVSFLQDAAFVREFTELYQFYKEAKLLQLREFPGKILAIFQTGVRLQDIKVFRWSVSPQGDVSYIDNRGERDHIFPDSHDFEWTRSTRDDQVQGRHPHISIEDRVFVETIGGDLTIKVENNSEDGKGIYSEDVDDDHQSLDDGDIQYTSLGGLILLKIKPYREETYRYLVFNERTHQVKRIDAVGESCILLPEDHGFIFPGGYYLQSGETKLFDVDAKGMEFKRRIHSPNGEDVLYIFHHRTLGLSILLTYNLIQKEVQPPIFCHGYGLYPDGRLIVFQSKEDATRVHPMQIWQTPFFDDDHAGDVHVEGYLGKLGNAELVRGISDLNSIRKMILDQAPSIKAYEDLITELQRIIDNYHWMDHDSAGHLVPLLRELLGTTELIVDEYEKILTLKKRAESAVNEAKTGLKNCLKDIRPDAWSTIDLYVTALGSLRRQRGHTISLKEVKYVDLEALESIEEDALTAYERLSHHTVNFLLKEEALASYAEGVSEALKISEEAQKTLDLKPALANIETMSEGLNLLTEVISGLKVEDPTKRTQILDSISAVFSQLNRARAVVENRNRSLLNQEGRAEFASEFTLFSQGVTGALAQATTPERCDELLSRIMVQLEELDARFGEFEDFIADLADKREEVFEAFEGRKNSLVEARQRRSLSILKAAERILVGVKRRAQSFKTLDELNTFFASDAMVMKVRDLGEQLIELKESVKADELASKVKSGKQEAIRTLRDKSDLYEEGASVIRLGRHRFSVNTQPLELTLLLKNDVQNLHITGTDFFEPVEAPALQAAQTYWSQTLVSETPSVYRGEYLAYALLKESIGGAGTHTLQDLLDANNAGTLVNILQERASARYDEGYERGVHDSDGSAILSTILELWERCGLLRFAPGPRAIGALFYAHCQDKEQLKRWHAEARSLDRLRRSLNRPQALEALAKTLGRSIGSFIQEENLSAFEGYIEDAGLYLAEELSKNKEPAFVLSVEAQQLSERLLTHMDKTSNRQDLDADLTALRGDLPRSISLLTTWLLALVENDENSTLSPSIPEAAIHLLTQGSLSRELSDGKISNDVKTLLGQHPLIQEGTLPLRLDHFMSRLNHFQSERVPGYLAFKALRHDILATNKERLRLDEFQPRIMSAFVRNKLINDVYLPLIGDNLAKQMGALGAGRRTDLMGILLLISPPGYGKTTLMEYISNRLGLIFMKINGPALGHGVTSLDPAEAPSATARQEVEKLNLALEMGNNVMIYLDDIQHTHPELLQKFISLCDAQRKIEGVWRGKSRTYDLRGKKVCVVMAGNPYTESGDRFQIPDMLSNRADTYNLGDILGGTYDAFALSYIENTLTSNPSLAPLATREQEDVYKIINMAKGEDVSPSELSHDYSRVELDELISLFQKLFKVQDLLLKVNQNYILSASQEDAYRTEPPFKLQGSYRNMNKIAEKVVSAMNDEELEQILTDHYVSEAQTLTTGAEANLLKLAELRENSTEEQALRWREIKKTYGRLQASGDSDEDPVNRIVGQLSSLVMMVEQVGTDMGTGPIGSISEGIDRLQQTLVSSSTPGYLKQLQAAIESGLSQLTQSMESTQVPSVIESSLSNLSQSLDPSGFQTAMESALAGIVQSMGTTTVDGLPEGFKSLEERLKLLVNGVSEGNRNLESTLNDLSQNLLESENTILSKSGGQDPSEAMPTAILPASPSPKAMTQATEAIEAQLGKANKHLDLIARVLFSDWRARNPGKGKKK